MKKVFLLFITLLILKHSDAQDSVKVVKQDSLVVNQDSINNIQVNTVTKTNEINEAVSKYPYKTSFKKDAPVKDDLVTDEIKKQQKEIRDNIYKVEKEYLDIKYACDVFVSGTITEQNRKTDKDRH